MNGEIFFEHGSEAGRIEKWSIDRNESVFVAKFNGSCYGLFIDLNNSLYCSLHEHQRVMKISLDSDRRSELVAGDGSVGSAAHQLNYPRGIFVDREFTLFVADGENHRVQRFRPGEKDGTTVVGRGALLDPQFNISTDVMMDEHGHLYIADDVGNRVIRSNGREAKCIAGCNTGKGSKADQLDRSYAVQLDKDGNLYVADEFNHRIQRFELIRGSCQQSEREGQILSI